METGNKEEGILTPFLEEIKNFSNEQKGELEILKANAINKDYIRKITPSNRIYNYLDKVFKWKSPMHSLLFGLCFSIFFLFPDYLIIIALFVFYFKTNDIFKKLMKIKKTKNPNESLIERNKRKLLKYKNNVIHIQVFCFK